MDVSKDNIAGSSKPEKVSENKHVTTKVGQKYEEIKATTFIAFQQVNNYSSKDTQKEASSKTENSSDQTSAEKDNPVPDSIKLTETIYLLHRETISKYGNVCKGIQIHGQFGKKVIAIKTLKYNEANEKEAKILVKLCPHGNVANIIQSGVYETGPIVHIFIAMEMCDSQNLAEFIKSVGSQSLDAKFRQAQQLLDGITHIHENDIIHRDLKPDNVLLSTNGNFLKIIDFGLSKEMTSGRSVTNLSTLRIGTNGWRAPETYISDVISKSSDIYSFGLVLYFIWSDGDHPFGDDPDDWNRNIKKNIGLNLSKLYSEAVAKDLLSWMLKFETRQRPTVAQIKAHEYFGGNLSAPRSNLSKEEAEIDAKKEERLRAIKQEYEDKIKALEEEIKREKDEVARKAKEEEFEVLLKSLDEFNRGMQLEVERQERENSKRINQKNCCAM